LRTLAALGLVALLAASCLASSAAPDVVLVTLDTVRSDRMGFLGSKRGLTPALDTLAREAVVFEQAFAQAPLTTVSHATILSGTYPPTHGVQDFGIELPASLPWLPAALAARGYQTGAFVGSIVLDPKGPIAPGFDRGFSVYDAGFERRRDGADPYKTKERRGMEVVSRALAWLAGRRGVPVFLWVHLYDAHDPYDAPEPFASRFAKAPYDAEIAGVDAALGRLVEGLRALGRLDGAVMAVAADHGESLGAHGEDTHGVFLYDETIHVPMLVRLPRGDERGRRVPLRVSLVDVAPTLLEAAGLAIPEAMQGVSLLPLARGARASERPAYAESEYSHRVFGWSPLHAWRSERFLFVEAPRRELYDQRADPGSTRNLASERPAIVAGMSGEIERARSAWSARARPSAPAKADPELVERLASLGYAAGATAGALPPPSGVDPKDKIQVTNLLQRATEAGESGRWDAAIPLYEKVVASDPQIFTARLELGLALARKREWARALPHLKLVAERLPDYADARFTLGLAYSSLGRNAEAIAELRAALAQEPGHKAAAALLEKLQASGAPPSPPRD
jgi:arylsulfatase A-like enzyme